MAENRVEMKLALFVIAIERSFEEWTYLSEPAFGKNIAIRTRVGDPLRGQKVNEFFICGRINWKTQLT